MLLNYLKPKARTLFAPFLEFWGIFIHFFLHNVIMSTAAHPDVDLDGLTLFEAQVQLRRRILSGFLSGEFTFLFHPPVT